MSLNPRIKEVVLCLSGNGRGDAGRGSRALEASSHLDSQGGRGLRKGRRRLGVNRVCVGCCVQDSPHRISRREGVREGGLVDFKVT